MIFQTMVKIVLVGNSNSEVQVHGKLPELRLLYLIQDIRVLNSFYLKLFLALKATQRLPNIVDHAWNATAHN